MQYKTNIKLIIDKRKLDMLIRMGCPHKPIIELLTTNTFTKTGDALIDETLECLIDVKEFSNWGGTREGSGRHRKTAKNNQVENHLENQDENQDENQVGNHLANQDTNQVADKDIDKDIDNINIKRKENIKEKKLKVDDITDWDTLFTYWEQNKRGGKYKNAESRNRQLKKLKDLTRDDFEFAKKAILHCIDNGYYGFTNGKELYYKGQLNTMEGSNACYWRM